MITGFYVSDLFTTAITGVVSNVVYSAEDPAGNAHHGPVPLVFVDVSNTGKNPATLTVEAGMWDGSSTFTLIKRIAYLAAQEGCTVTTMVNYIIPPRDPNASSFSAGAIRVSTVGDANVRAHIRTQGIIEQVIP